ncbi:MAG: D-2-hydroxyacid dehydrogenase [Gammaproteobacteria bacterium]|nr:D-2-hydroxyacid dehydrogenase [Gammaproteobacteria bacterium]
MDNYLLIVGSDFDEYLRLLGDGALPGLEVRGFDNQAQAQAWLPRANILLGPPGMISALLDQTPRLQWVQSTYAGVEPLCRPGLRRDYLLTGVKGLFGPLMSEYVFGYILAIQRRLFDMRQQQREHRWQPIPYRSLRGLVLGICGLGSIGMHLAETGASFAMRVTGYRRTPSPCPAVERTYSGSELGDFLAELDYLVLALPDTPDTRHIIDRGALERMKASAVIINVGRGSSIVETDLSWALQQRRLAGAVLDVFAHEPLPAASPLWDMPGCIVTPHISALSFPADIVALFARNYRRFITGRPLEYRVNFERGY